MKVKHKVALAASLIVAIAFTTFSTIQYVSVRTALYNQAERNTQEATILLSKEISSWLLGKLSQINLMSQVLDADFSTESINRIFNVPVLKDEFLLVFGGLDTDGKAIGNDPSWNPPDSWDARARPWYPYARNNSQAVLTAPYADSTTGEILISAVAKFTDNGRFMGAFGGDISLQTVADALNQVSFNNTGYAFLVDRDGTIVSHPDTDLNGEPLTRLLGNQPLPSFTDQLQTVMVKGEAQLTAFQPVDALPGSDWLVGVMLDKGKVMAEANRFGVWAILGAVISTLISCLILYLLMDRILKPLEQLGVALAEISKGGGDLTRRLDIKSKDEFGHVASAFDAFIAYLQNLISEIKREAGEIRSNADTTAATAASSAASIRKQLDELDQLATAMHQMSATAHEVSQNAQMTAQAAQQADGNARDGASVMLETRESIDHLVEDMGVAVENINQLTLFSNNIESILTTIVNISEQTNLLALNAAIEAARAGDLGRGFAVVADEVRALASRTQQSTTEIRGMIDQLQKGVSDAETSIRENTERAQQTQEKALQASQALEDIRDNINSINQMTVQIATAAEQQSSTSEEINRNTSNIRDLSQKVAEEAGEQERLCQAMNKMSNAQSQQLSKFKV